MYIFGICREILNPFIEMGSKSFDVTELTGFQVVSGVTVTHVIIGVLIVIDGVVDFVVVGVVFEVGVLIVVGVIRVVDVGVGDG